MVTPTTPPRASGTTVIACLALLLSGIAVGILIGRWAESQPPMDVHAGGSATVPVDLSPVLAELRQLNETMSRSRTGDVPPSQENQGRQVVATGGSASDRLVAAIEKLTESLESGKGRSLTGKSSDSRRQAPGYGSLDEMWQRIIQQVRSSASGAKEEMGRELTKAHLLWTPDDLVDRYGPPASVAGSESGLCLIYGAELEPGKPINVYFDVHAGVVTSVRGP